MTQPPKLKTLLRSSRWLLPPAALLLLFMGVGGRQALTYSRGEVNQGEAKQGERRESPRDPSESAPRNTDPEPAIAQPQTATAHPVDAEHSLESILLAQNGSNQVAITTQGNKRVIRANGIPAHSTGTFPNCNNPSAIAAQSYTLEVPLNPQIASQVTFLRRQSFGIALNGVPFDPGAAEFWGDGQPRQTRSDSSSGCAGQSRRSQSGNSRRGSQGDRNWQYEALATTPEARLLGLDHNNGHVQPTGAYHYHGLPTGLIERLGRSKALVGYAADGFPIYVDSTARSSYRLKLGQRPSNGPSGAYDGTFVQDYEYVPGSGNLDECNGRTGATPDYPAGIYHYALTADFPSIPRCFRGTPDASFKRGPNRQGQGQGRPGQDQTGRSQQGRPQGRPGRPPHGEHPPHHRPPRRF